MKKVVTVCLVLILAFTLFANGVSENKDDKVTISFGFWGDTPEANMKMELAKAYMAKKSKREH